MTWTLFAVNVFFAGLLLFINGCLGKWKQHTSSLFCYSSFGFSDTTTDSFSDNFFQLLIHPAIYLAIISAILQAFSQESVVHSLWLVVPLYWLLRFFIAIYEDTFFFSNWRFQLYLFLVSLLLSEGTLFLILIPLMNADKSIFIDHKAFRDAFWFAVFAYIFKFLWEYSKLNMVGNEVFPPSQKTDVIIRRYHRFYRKYSRIINASIDRECRFKSSNQRDHFVCMVYAIMIFESHNRPLWKRVMEYIVKVLCPNRLMTLGIMQVQTNRWISNDTSILFAIRKLYNAFCTAPKQSAIEESIADYNPSATYSKEVFAIYQEITVHLNLAEYGRQKVSVRKRSYAHTDA